MTTERHEVKGDDQLAEDHAKKVDDLVGDHSKVEGMKQKPEIHDNTELERKRLHPDQNK